MIKKCKDLCNADVGIFKIYKVKDYNSMDD